MRLRLPVFVLFTFLATGCASTTTFDGGAGPGPGWSFTDTEGNAHSRDLAAGKPTLLFFMATWCPKCQATAPRLADLHMANQGSANFFTLSWDPQEGASDLTRWRQQYGQDWPHGIDTGSEIARTFGVTSQSSIVVLDGSGQMVKRWLYDRPTVASMQAALDEAASRAQDK